MVTLVGGWEDERDFFAGSISEDAWKEECRLMKDYSRNVAALK